MINRSDFYPSSPVEADKFLWADEKPFTAFGQLGQGLIDIRVFEQAVWWVDIKGEEHLLSEMSTEYLNSVVKHLFSNVERFYVGALLRHTIEYILSVMEPDATGPSDFTGFVAYVKAKASPRELEPGEWLNSTPLVKRIFELIDSKD